MEEKPRAYLYPAIAIANELKKRNPEANFLFVGAKDRMEMEKCRRQVIKLKVWGILVYRN
ncbi:MAG: hypothetical protein R2821_03535 [Flavobacteriaceae bacterium]